MPSSPLLPRVPSPVRLRRRLPLTCALSIIASAGSPAARWPWEARRRPLPLPALAGAIRRLGSTGWLTAWWLWTARSRPHSLPALAPRLISLPTADRHSAKPILHPSPAPPEIVGGSVLLRVALAPRAPALPSPRCVAVAHRFCVASHLELTWRSPRGCAVTWCRMCGSACRSASFVRLRSHLALSPPFLVRARLGPRGGGGDQGAPAQRQLRPTASRRGRGARSMRSSASGIPLRRMRRHTRCSSLGRTRSLARWPLSPPRAPLWMTPLAARPRRPWRAPPPPSLRRGSDRGA